MSSPLDTLPASALEILADDTHPLTNIMRSIQEENDILTAQIFLLGKAIKVLMPAGGVEVSTEGLDMDGAPPYIRFVIAEDGALDIIDLDGPTV